MKLNEKQLRNIIKKSLMEIIDSYDEDFEDLTPEERKELEMQDMYDEYGNRSQYMHPAAQEICDTNNEYEEWEEDDIDDNSYENPGFLSMIAQGGNPNDIDKDFQNLDAEPDNQEYFNKMIDDTNAKIAQRPDLWASKKPGSYRGLSGEIYESKINKIVNESIKKFLGNDILVDTI